MKKLFIGSVAITALTAMVVVIALTFLRDSTTAAPPETGDELLSAGLGTEADLPNTVQEVPSRVASALEFIKNRSSIDLSLQTEARIRELEEKTLTQERFLTTGQVGAIFTQVFFQKLSTLTDSDIQTMTTENRLVPDFKDVTDFVQLRRHDTLNIFASDWFDIVKAYRDGSTPEALVWRALTEGKISDAVNERKTAWAGAINEWERVGLSPLQIGLLAYSLSLDDYMMRSSAQLAAYVAQLESVLQTQYGIPPGSANRPAFGYDGYLYKSSGWRLFNDQTVNNILDLVEQQLED